MGIFRIEPDNTKQTDNCICPLPPSVAFDSPVHNKVVYNRQGHHWFYYKFGPLYPTRGTFKKWATYQINTIFSPKFNKFFPTDQNSYVSFRSQYVGDSSIKTRSFLVGFFISLSIGLSLSLVGFPFLFSLLRTGLTLNAPSNFSRIFSPTSRNGVSTRQQTFIVHEPDTPWHLHDSPIEFLRSCKPINMHIFQV